MPKLQQTSFSVNTLLSKNTMLHESTRKTDTCPLVGSEETSHLYDSSNFNTFWENVLHILIQ